MRLSFTLHFTAGSLEIGKNPVSSVSLQFDHLLWFVLVAAAFGRDFFCVFSLFFLVYRFSTSFVFVLILFFSSFFKPLNTKNFFFASENPSHLIVSNSNSFSK